MELNFDYDENADVLYAHYGEPRDGYCTEHKDGILIRHCAKTNVIIGFTIINYSKQREAGYTKSIPHFEGVEIPF